MRYCGLLGLIIFSQIAPAAPSKVWWPGWKVESSEELSQGVKYTRNDETPVEFG